MSERFYAPDLLAGSPVRLEGPEAHHLANVCRRAVGERVRLFDGRGHEAAAEITALEKRAAELRVLEVRGAAEQGASGPTLAAAVPKGERFRWLIEKATELGVGRLIPLRTARSVVHPGGGKLAKMQRTVIAACKQSGRNTLMPIEPPMPWEAFVDREAVGRTVLVAHPGGQPLREAVAGIEDPRSVVLAVGPEGGLADEEIGRAQDAGARCVDLGPATLRTETAAVALAAYCRLALVERQPENDE